MAWIGATDLEATLGLRADVAARAAVSVASAEAEARLLVGVAAYVEVVETLPPGDAWREAVRRAVCVLTLCHALPTLALVFDTGELGGVLGGSYDVESGEGVVSKRYLGPDAVARFAAMLRGQAYDLLGRTGLALTACRDDADTMGTATFAGIGVEVEGGPRIGTLRL